MGTSKRIKRKVGQSSSGAAIELWKLEFSTCEFDRQVVVVDSTQDHDTSMALACAVLLSNDVAALTEETLDTIGDLLVMH